MKNKRLCGLAGAILGVTLGWGCSIPAFAQGDPSPSWNDTPTKQAIIDFFDRVTKAGGPDFVASTNRIATCDDDGTLRVEQPMNVQMAFAPDRVKTPAPQHPKWEYTDLFQSALDGDTKALAESDERGTAYALAPPFITPLPNANTPMIDTRMSAVSTPCWTPLPLEVDRDRREEGLEGDPSVREALNLCVCSETLY